ncbi:MAG TPA: valine--tRNA ligase, partial [Candidatus Saccharimonadales bacterium]
NLHIGHALDNALKDIMVRYQRMSGRDTIYIPGADHAGFETWVVYEKELQKQGHSRFDFSREKLYNDVWDFVAARRGDMELQMRALGASADWDSLVFTLDDKVIRTVYDTFKQLWDDGLVYRGERIVNYCLTHQTSFADIEVTYRDEDDKLWNIAYPLLDREGEIVVATTRPETLLGDTAIAVHPDDERYKDLIGTSALVPIIKREIPIVGDEAVDPAFGSGAVKVTPAHDPTDYDIGQRHDLPAINVIGHDGLMTAQAGQFSGLTIESARTRLLSALQSDESLRGEQPLTHAVGHCYKCGNRIQPLMKEQWFLRVGPLAETAIAALEAGEVSFTPASRRDVLVRYLRGLRDWNLSRQIPWGIPIPAFQNVADESDWIFDARVEQATIEINGKTYRREEDTFDTWFSSGQWPYIVTDALEQGSELNRFYPTDLMEHGSDILYAWTSRMLMLGLYRTGKAPFKNVYLHGMVNDEHNQKMSKSKGNVINPIEMVDTYGSDALRLGIIANRTAAQNQAFSTASVIAGRNFCNKLWNMARFIEPHLEGVKDTTLKPTTLADHWVIERLETARKTIETHLAAYRYAEAGETLYHAVWGDVADWYLEASKESPSPAMLAWVLETCLTLSHPFAPFVTEAIWTTLERHESPLISRPWPKKTPYDAIAAGEFERLKALVVETRYVTSELPGGRQVMLYEHDSLIADNEALIARLAGLSAVTHVEQPSGLRLAVPNREAWLRVSEDVLYEHQSKLEVRLADVRVRIDALQARLANKRYVEAAPKNVVADTRHELDEQTELFKRLSRELQVLE